MTPPSRLRHFGSALAHSVSPSAWRQSFALRPADAIFAPAFKVGVAATLVLVVGGLLGHEQLVGVAALGALTSAFGRYQPYGRLARMLAIVAAALLLSVAAGSLLGVAGAPLDLQILALALIAAIAAHLFSALGITGPGPVILVFAATAAVGSTHSASDILPLLIFAFIGSAVGWIVALAPALIFPMGPARLATARAIAAVLRHKTDDGGAHLGAAVAALRSARNSVALSVRTSLPTKARTARLRSQGLVLSAVLDEAETLLHGREHTAADLENLALHEAALRTLRRPATPTGSVCATQLSALPDDTPPAGLLEQARIGLRVRSSANQALRMAAAAALSGWAAVGLGLDHPLWASMGAVAALQGLNYSITVQRSIQRLVGNIAGALVAMALLSMSLGFWPSVALVIVFQVLAELLVLKNYTLTTIAVTPMALIMTGLGSQLAPGAALSRVADTLVGVVIAVLVAAVSISLADRHHLPEKPITAALSA